MKHIHGLGTYKWHDIIKFVTWTPADMSLRNMFPMYEEVNFYIKVYSSKTQSKLWNLILIHAIVNIVNYVKSTSNYDICCFQNWNEFTSILNLGFREPTPKSKNDTVFVERREVSYSNLKSILPCRS